MKTLANGHCRLDAANDRKSFRTAAARAVLDGVLFGVSGAARRQCELCEFHTSVSVDSPGLRCTAQCRGSARRAVVLSFHPARTAGPVHPLANPAETRRSGLRWDAYLDAANLVCAPCMLGHTTQALPSTCVCHFAALCPHCICAEHPQAEHSCLLPSSSPRSPAFAVSTAAAAQAVRRNVSAAWHASLGSPARQTRRLHRQATEPFVRRRKTRWRPHGVVGGAVPGRHAHARPPRRGLGAHLSSIPASRHCLVRSDGAMTASSI